MEYLFLKYSLSVLLVIIGLVLVIFHMYYLAAGILFAGILSITIILVKLIRYAMNSKLG